MARMKTNSPETDLTMHVVNHIRTLIEKGELRPGDKLPPEREFANTLKISRASLRTGIGQLVAMGVMKVRHGVGTFVDDGPAEFSTASLSLMGALHGFQSWQMFEARLIVECSLAALAAERGKQEHHAALAEELAEMYATAEAPAEFLKHDVLFHRILAQASGNPILAALMETITSAMYEKRRTTVERADYLHSMAEMHREIYRAIRGHNPAEARKAMEHHLRTAQSAEDMECTAVAEKQAIRTRAKPQLAQDRLI